MHARYFHFLSQTNSASKITLATSVQNLVQIGEKLHLLAMIKEKILFLLKSVGTLAKWIILFRL